jgi:two-component system, OmpR family, sensor histidine kinase VicK
MSGQELTHPSRENETTTDVLCGVDNVIDVELGFFANSKKRIDTCMNYTRPSFAVILEPIKKALLDAKNRGVKLRYLTEINHYNVAASKELMTIVDELRHLDGIKGNFVLSEKEYLAPVILFEKDKVASDIICSNVKEILDQHHYMFDTLWNKAISAQRRIKELDEGITPIRTKILYHQDEIIKEIKRKNNCANKLSICSAFGAMQMSYDLLFGSYEKVIAKYRKGESEGIRWIINIDKESIPLVKTFLEAGILVKHIKNIQPINFGVSDKEVAITIEQMEGGKLSRSFLISNDPVYTIHLNSVFEELWKNGIDAEDRIRDIEVGAEWANVEVIQISSRPRPIVKSHEVGVVLTALADNEMKKILDSAMNQSKSVNEILKETNIPHSSGFRRIKWLLNEGLIMLDKIIITPDGKKFSLYHSTLKSISVKYEDTTVVVKAEPNFAVTKKSIMKFFSLD